jgi:hypothetical protein
MRSPQPQPAPFSRPQVIVAARRRRPALVRAAVRHHVRLLRSIVFAPPARQPIVSHARAAHRVRYTRRHRAIVLRAPVFVPAAVVRPSITVTRRRRAVTVRAFYGRQQGARIMRTPLSTQTPTPLVRRRLVLETQTGNRPRVVARVRHRHAYVLRSRTGATFSAVTGRFDGSAPHGAVDALLPGGDGFDGGPTGGLVGASASGGHGFDGSPPGSVNT